VAGKSKKPWWAIAPIPSPLDSDGAGAPPPDNRKHTTRRGRVVYARRRHPFTARDVRRVWLGAFRPATYSVGGLLSSLVKFDLVIVRFLLETFPKKDFLVWRWLGDYTKGLLDGIRELLREAGWAVDEVSLATGGEAPGEEGIPV